jgi:hypothetical protein
MQSYEGACRGFDPATAPPAFDVTSWYTYVARCPECQEAPQIEEAGPVILPLRRRSG